MFEANGTMIRISRGDTGLLRIMPEPLRMGEDDRAVFTIARRGGGILMEKILKAEADGALLIPFTNDETEDMPVGDYEWDIRIVLDARLDAQGRPTDGREVIMPMRIGRIKIMKVVGEV